LVEQLGNDPQLLFPTWNFNSSQWEWDFALKLDGFIEQQWKFNPEIEICV